MPESMPRIGDTIRQIRERRGLTQRQLSEQSGVRLNTVRDLEQHPDRGTRMDVLRRLATALDVSTSELLRTRRPDLVDAGAQTPPAMLGLRSVLSPIPRVPGVRIALADAPTLARITSGAQDALVGYTTDDYAHLTDMLPALITGSRLLVQSTSGREHVRASGLLSEILRTAGMMLRQLEEYDLAVLAYSEALEAAGRVDDHLRLAYAAARMGDVYMCQTRYADATRLCTQAADLLNREGRGPRLDVARARATVLTTAAAAAIRDNSDTEAMLDEATAVVGPLPRADESAVRVAAIRAEVAMIADEPDGALDHARGVPRTTVTTLHPNMVRRHRLTEVHANVRLGRARRAVELLDEIGDDAPQWLARQPYGREVVNELIEGQRRLSADLARAADLVGMPV